MRTPSLAINRTRWVWAFFFIFALACLHAIGCSKKTPKYPEDHVRFQHVMQAIKALETAYVNQDAATFHELLLPLEQLEILAAGVRQDFEKFSTIQLEFTVDRIVIEGNRISSFMSWQGSWQKTNQQARESARGHGVLLWSGNNVILLRGIEGDLPFGIASRLNRSS